MSVRKFINTTWDAFQFWAKNGSNAMVKVFGIDRDGALQLTPLVADPTAPTGTAINVYNKSGVVYVQDSVYGPRAPVFGGVAIQNQSVPGTYTAAPSVFYTNTGASGTVVFNLPTPNPALGDQISFVVTQDTKYIQVVAPGGTTIRNGSVVSASGGYFRNPSVGSVLSLISVSPTSWVAYNISGVWLVDE